MILKRFICENFSGNSSHVLAISKFGVVGAVTAGIYFLAMWISDTIIHLNYVVSVSVAYSFSTIFHFFANKYFTFGSLCDRRVEQVFRYLVMWLVNYVITIVVVKLTVEMWFLSPYLGVCISVAFTMVTGYVLGRYWVFKIKG